MCHCSHKGNTYRGLHSVAAGMIAIDLRSCISKVVDSVLTNLKGMARIISRSEPLLIIAEDVENEALCTQIINKLHGIKECNPLLLHKPRKSKRWQIIVLQCTFHPS